MSTAFHPHTDGHWQTKRVDQKAICAIILAPSRMTGQSYCFSQSMPTIGPRQRPWTYLHFCEVQIRNRFSLLRHGPGPLIQRGRNRLRDGKTYGTAPRRYPSRTAADGKVL